MFILQKKLRFTTDDKIYFISILGIESFKKHKNFSIYSKFSMVSGTALFGAFFLISNEIKFCM